MSVDELDPTFVSRNFAQYSARPDEDYPLTFEGVHRRKDGTTFPVEIRLAPLYIAGRRFMLSFAATSPSAKRAEEALQKERRLLHNLLNLHEHDRQLMAYEIHDGLAQLLDRAHCKFQSIPHLQTENPSAAAAAFDEAVQLLAKGIAESRRLISGLRRPFLTNRALWRPSSSSSANRASRTVHASNSSTRCALIALPARWRVPSFASSRKV